MTKFTFDELTQTFHKRSGNDAITMNKMQFLLVMYSNMPQTHGTFPKNNRIKSN